MKHQVFVDFYEHHYNLIHSVAHQRLGSLTEAEELTAETFRIAWEHYSHGGELTTPWLYQVLRNLVGDEYRRQKRVWEATTYLKLYEETRLDEGFNTDVLDVRSAIAKLGIADQEIIRMAYWEHLTHKEISQLLRCTAATVRVRLFRAKRRLRAVLGDSYDGISRNKDTIDG